MNRNRRVVVAVAVAALVIAANAAVALMAAATNSPPETATFGITGLTAALIALLIAILWVWRSEPAPSFGATARAEPHEPAPPRMTPAPAQPSPGATAGAVIDLQAWLKAHAPHRLNA